MRVGWSPLHQGAERRLEGSQWLMVEVGAGTRQQVVGGGVVGVEETHLAPMEEVVEEEGAREEVVGVPGQEGVDAPNACPVSAWPTDGWL